MQKDEQNVQCMLHNTHVFQSAGEIQKMQKFSRIRFDRFFSEDQNVVNEMAAVQRPFHMTAA